MGRREQRCPTGAEPAGARPRGFGRDFGRDFGRGFGGARGGSVAVTFGLGATVLLGLVGGGIDYARLTARRSHLQGAVDAGTLAGGNALKLALATNDSVVSVTENVIRIEAHSPADRPLAVAVSVAADKTSVEATAEETMRLAFGGLVGLGSVKLGVRARASVVGRMRLCMLALDPLAPGAFSLKKSAQVTASGCALYADSRAPNAMTGEDSAIARAQTICSAGGYVGPRANFSPAPQTGCPVIEDPLKARSMPTPGDCASLPARFDKKGLLVRQTAIDDDIALEPGTYCGGLRITKKARVTLKPGTYVFKDGPLLVDGQASLTGIDVSLHFTGDKGGLLFDKKTSISLSAPVSGSMAGLLISEARTVSGPVDPLLSVGDSILSLLIPPTPAPLGATRPMRTYRIISDDARTMLGTIYLPAGRLVIDADRPVADQSAYTVVVAQQIALYEGPNLVLNANYDATSVPVPAGVGPRAGRILLSQ